MTPRGPRPARCRTLVSHELPLDQAVDAYDKFNKRADAYTKVILHP
jgi:glutathione-independent formaldehyde dehydrogenase